MKSIIKFLLYFLAVVLVITWLVTIYKAGQEEIDPNASLSDEMVEEAGMGEDEDVLAVMNEEELDEEYNNILNEVGTDEEKITGDSDEAESDPMEYEEEEEAANNDTQSASKKHVEAAPAAPISSATEEPIVSNHGENTQPYMVIVGSFLVPNNADKRKREISKLGFNAEVVNFDLSQYHTVLAGRYDSYADAQSAVKKLKAKGVDAYAKKREK